MSDLIHTNSTSLVAIKCLVYNHEPYLRDCLEGFVMQQTNFSFVAIVHDDASTDGSAAIIREYEEKYPDIIKPIYESENQYSKHDGSLGQIMNAAVDATGAKYIAMCEGDDYWTDPLKLQKQVDFMESHEDYVLSYTNYNNVDQLGNPMTWANREKNIQRSYTGDVLAELLKGNYIQTCTVLFRRSIYQDKNYKGKIDYALFLQCALMGKCVFLPEQTSCYRIQSDSIIHTQCTFIHDILQDVWFNYVERYNSEAKYQRSGREHIKIMLTISSRLISMLKSNNQKEKFGAKEILRKDPKLYLHLPLGIFVKIYYKIQKMCHL